MRKYIAFLLSILIIFSLVACTNDTDNSSNSIVDVYKNKATEFIESGDTQSAITVLEEGVSKTNDEGLKTMLEELKNGDSSNPSDQNQESGDTQNQYLKYAGAWAAENYEMFYAETDLSLEIDFEGTKMKISLRYEYLPNNIDYLDREETVAEITKEVDISEIKENTLVVNYENDGCSNSGKIRFTFLDTFILCESDYFTQDDYNWGFLFHLSKFERIKY